MKYKLYTLTILCILLMMINLDVVAGKTPFDKLPDVAFPEITGFISNGDYEIALQIIAFKEKSLQNNATPLELLLLKARALQGLGKTESARAIWSGLSLRDSSLKQNAYRASFELHLQDNDPASAEQKFEQLRSLNYRAIQTGDNINLANGYRRLGNIPKAEGYYYKVFKKTTKSKLADQARIGLIKTAIAKKKYATAQKIVKTLRFKFREPDCYKEALKLAGDIESRFGAKIEKISSDEWKTIIERLADRSEFDLALSELEKWKKGSGLEGRDRQQLAKIEIFYRQRKNLEALELCRMFEELHKKSSLLFSVRFKKLLLFQRLGMTDQLVELGQNFIDGKLVCKSSQRKSVAMVMASYLVSVGRVDEGLDKYRYVFRSGASRSLKNDILWKVGLGALRDGQIQRAENNLKALLKQKINHDTRLSVYYWLANIALHKQHPQDAFVQLIKIVKASPYSFYGVRALDVINSIKDRLPGGWYSEQLASVEKQRKEFPKLEVPGTVYKDKSYIDFHHFARAGLFQEAAEHLESLHRSYKGNKAIALLRSRAYAAAGDHDRSVRTLYNYFRQYCISSGRNLPEDFWKLYFPRPFMETVNTAARLNKVDPMLMISLMRQESRFDPKAKSWIGALGLFQIMPYTAERLAPEIGLNYQETDHLFNPKINASIAAHLASTLLNKFDFHNIPSIASYNAGEDRVSAWWEAAKREKIAEELFIDTIPYKETRKFVKAVLLNYHVYKKLYDDDISNSE